MNYAQTALTAFGLEKVEGQVALELELEGRNLPTIKTKMWKSHADGSLKVGGVEYVHNGPKSLDEVEESLLNFADRIEKSSATVYESERTSVHAHLNMQEKTIKQIIQAATAYYMVEPALMNIAGEKRKGNLFCLTMETAPSVKEYMKALSDGTASRVNTDKYRYASLNFGALKKFGSLEVRTMRGYYEPEYLTKWAKGLRSLFDRAADMKSPSVVLDSYYGKTKEEFLEQFFDGEFIDLIKSFDSWDDRLDRNHKHLTFLYKTDWSKSEEDFPKQEKVVSDFEMTPLFRTAIPTRRTIPERLYMEIANPLVYRDRRNHLQELVQSILTAWFPNLDVTRLTTEVFDTAWAQKYFSTIYTDGTSYYVADVETGTKTTLSNAAYCIADIIDTNLGLSQRQQEDMPEDEDDIFFGDIEE